MPDRGSIARQPRQGGVTLVEQVMVVAVMATLLGAAMPSMSRLLERSQLQTAQADLISALHHTREAAVVARQDTVFCPSRDGQQCADEERWDYGWLLAADRDHDNQPDGQPLYASGNHDERLTIQSSVGRHHVRFQADGSARGNNLTFVLCRQGNADRALSVVVANSGRIRAGQASSEQATACAQQR